MYNAHRIKINIYIQIIRVIKIIREVNDTCVLGVHSFSRTVVCQIFKSNMSLSF